MKQEILQRLKLSDDAEQSGVKPPTLEKLEEMVATMEGDSSGESR